MVELAFPATLSYIDAKDSRQAILVILGKTGGPAKPSYTQTTWTGRSTLQGPPRLCSNTLKLHASNRARADYVGRWGVIPPSTQSCDFCKLEVGRQGNGHRESGWTLVFFMVDKSMVTNSTSGMRRNPQGIKRMTETAWWASRTVGNHSEVTRRNLA